MEVGARHICFKNSGDWTSVSATSTTASIHRFDIHPTVRVLSILAGSQSSKEGHLRSCSAHLVLLSLSIYFHFGGEKTCTQVCCPQILSANLGLRHLSIGYPIIFKDLFWKTATSNFLPIPLKSNIFEITFVFFKKNLRFAMFDEKALEVWGCWFSQMGITSFSFSITVNHIITV